LILGKRLVILPDILVSAVRALVWRSTNGSRHDRDYLGAVNQGTRRVVTRIDNRVGEI
jgi:hypothetical protein